jgi:hypothetical protein
VKFLSDYFLVLVVENCLYINYFLQPLGCYKNTPKTSYNIPLMPLKFMIKYWELIYLFYASFLNKPLMLWVVKSTVISFIPCWYILLITTMVWDNKLNFLVHLSFELVYLCILVSRKGTNIFNKYSRTWQSLTIFETHFQSILQLVVLLIGVSLP